MSTTDTILLVVAIVVVTTLFVGIILGVLFTALRRKAAQSADEIRQRFPSARLVEAGANFFGQESLGVTQLRGNGTLVLTDSELYFKPWMGSREFRIPLSAIQSIETPTSYLGKTQFVPLLKVVYLGDAGRADSMAWRVRDLSGLIRALEEARLR